jgi:hypothetical protein
MNPRISSGQPSPSSLKESASIASPTTEWRFLAEKIVAYPQDFGMTRRDVIGLGRILAARRG